MHRVTNLVSRNVITHLVKQYVVLKELYLNYNISSVIVGKIVSMNLVMGDFSSLSVIERKSKDLEVQSLLRE